MKVTMTGEKCALVQQGVQVSIDHVTAKLVDDLLQADNYSEEACAAAQLFPECGSRNQRC